MASDQDRLLFRMQNIIPRSLSNDESRAVSNGIAVKPGSQANEPEEVEFQMTYGKIAGKVWGPPDGRPVLAVHGWLDNAGTFDKLIPLLPKDLRIIAVDIAGHGLSDPYPPDVAYNPLDSIIAFERFRRRFNWDKFSILGHSMGATFGMFYAGTFPERVDKIVLLDIARVPVTITQTIAKRLRRSAEKLGKYEEAILAGPEKPMSYEQAIKKGIQGSSGSLDEEACRILLKRGLKKVEGGYVFSRERRLLAPPLAFFPKEDQLAMARKTTAEALVIKFKGGPDFEPREDFMGQVEALKIGSKKVRYVEVEGSHHAHLIHPERVAPIISEFFSQ